MPIPFIVAGAALLGGAAAGGAAVAAAAEVAGAAVVGGIVGEMLSDDDKKKLQTDKKREIVPESEVPEDIRKKFDSNLSSCDIKELEEKAFSYYYGADGYTNHFLAKEYFKKATDAGSVKARQALQNLRFDC